MGLRSNRKKRGNRKSFTRRRKERKGRIYQHGGSNTFPIETVEARADEIRRILETRRTAGLQNWLVLFASFHSPLEKIRFLNPNWIFWDIGVSADDRFGFSGYVNKSSIDILANILKKEFDYIVFDDTKILWETSCLGSNEAVYKGIHTLMNLVKPGGKIVFNGRSYMNWILRKMDNKPSMDIINKETDMIYRYTINNQLYITPYAERLDTQTNLTQYTQFYKFKKDKLPIDVEDDLKSLGPEAIRRLKELYEDPKFLALCNTSKMHDKSCELYKDYYSLKIDDAEYFPIVHKYTSMWSLPTTSPIDPELFDTIIKTMNETDVYEDRDNINFDTDKNYIATRNKLDDLLMELSLVIEAVRVP
jgi:hypothetical protein